MSGTVTTIKAVNLINGELVKSKSYHGRTIYQVFKKEYEPKSNFSYKEIEEIAKRDQEEQKEINRKDIVERVRRENYDNYCRNKWKSMSDWDKSQF